MAIDRQAILIVDDKAANLLALERILGETGSGIVKAQSGEQALAATLGESFAMAILDVQMPGMDGYELAELLRGNPDTRSIPIVFLTADSSEDWQVFRGYESGAVDYIVKPYSPEILLSKVRVFLEMSSQKREFERSRSELAAVNRELEAFAYSVSHDLRAPLRAISGFSQLLLEDYVENLDEKGKDYLGRINSQVGHMEQLISDLLQLARVTRADMNWQRVDLSELAREIIEDLCESGPDRGAEVLISDSLKAEGDPVLLRQCLENLLSNAWKFTVKVRHAKIKVDSLEIEGQRTFFVEDNGVGFDMKYADNIFVPFQRLHSMEEYEGTGIGLSTVQRIVLRHGGRIWCDSAPGAGTTFFFTLGQNEGRQT